MGAGETGSFFKVDADRGFNQIVMTEDAVWSSAFAMLGELWVSERMLFGMKNGPPTFKRNAVIMQGELLQTKTKSYFDDIIGKSGRRNYTALRLVWISLLEKMCKHGWKQNLRKCEWGFEIIESVAFIWSKNGIGMNTKSIESMKAMKLPQTLTQVRAFLGLANQFRDRVSGYALMVSHHTSLTKSKSTKISLTTEAIIECENLKATLVSSLVLQQFNYTRKTIVYTHASVGTQDGLICGGLGVVIVQEDEEGKQYVCCFASSGLSAAQRNYHIVRLELLAFVYACSKFHE